jgi:hypothetical protein
MIALAGSRQLSGEFADNPTFQALRNTFRIDITQQE